MYCSSGHVNGINASEVFTELLGKVFSTKSFNFDLGRVLGELLKML
jgi:hypothetical protein